MVMFKEGIHNSEFIVSEGNGQISREPIVVEKGDALVSGQLLQLNETSGHYAVYASASSSKNESSEDKKEAKSRSSTRAGDVKLAILCNAIPSSTEPRNGVGLLRMAEVAGALVTGGDDAALEILESKQMIIIR